jgi:carbon storage regulator
LQQQDDHVTEGLAMLVLSRKLNEKIVINGNIVVTVVKIDRNQVRIGIEAPGEVPVYREEILPVHMNRHDEAELLLQA